jgi:hypothetical protein
MSILDRALDGAIRVGQGIATRMLNLAPPAVQTARARALANLESLYWGKQYEGRGLSPSWDKLPPGARNMPLRLQRPSVQYDIARSIVDRPTALLFGDGRFPTITLEPADGDADGADEAVTAVNKWLASIADEGGLEVAALTWSRQGGVLGSAVFTWMLVDGEFEFEAHKSSQCTPTFDPKKRSRLIALDKRYIFRKAVESIDPITNVRTVREVDFWHRETWDTTSHTVFKEVPADGGKEPSWEPEGEPAVHNFGFVPAVWTKNLDDGDCGSIDGISLIEGLEDIFEDVDRTLSQKSRAVRYNQDPERVYFGLDEKTKAIMEAIRVGGGASTVLPPKTAGAGAEMLELKGEGQTVAEAHIVAQRGRALEVSRVVMPDPERLLAASKSGAALRILFAPTLELVGELRSMYGRALRTIFEQILRAAREGKFAKLGILATPAPTKIPAGKVKLQWGSFFDPTPEDIDTIARAASTLKQAGLADRETLVRWLSSYLGINDVHAVLARLDEERDGEYGPMPNVNGTRPNVNATPPNVNGSTTNRDTKPESVTSGNMAPEQG